MKQSFIYPRGSSPQQTPQIDAEDDQIDLRAVFHMIWNGKWIIAICTLITTTLAFFYVSQIAPTYRASAKVIFDLQRQNITNIEEVIVSGDFSEDRLQNEIEILRSTALIERVIGQLNLANDPEFNPSLRVEEESIVDRMFGWITLPPELSELAESMGLARPDPPAPDPETFLRGQRLAVVSNVLGRLQLNPVRGSSVIEIGFVADDPRTAARIANAVADQYIVEQLEAKLEATRSATEWLSKRVLELQDKVETAEGRVEAMRSQLAQNSGQTLEVTRAQLTELNSTLSAVRARKLALDSQLERLVEALETNADIGSIPEFREAPLISSFRIDESELMSRAVSLRSSVGEDHPSMQRVNAQLNEVRRKMRQEAERVVQSVRVERDSAVDELTALGQSVRDLEEMSLSQSAAEIELRQLEREAQASRLLYENFLGRLQETSQQESLQSADARVITPAEVPNEPQAQSKKRTLLLGAMLGTIAGVGIILLLHRLNNTFRSAHQIEEMTGLPVLASVPIVGHHLHRRDVLAMFQKKPNSSLAEAIRNLRTSILFSDVDHPPKTVMFTSSVPREGKSTTSSLVALTSQQMGRSTILVDCDFRLPALSKILQFDEDKPGILSFMNGTAELDEAISTEPDSGLHVLMARQRETKTQLNPADVLSSQRFQALIQSLSEKYDLVVLDTPPALVVSDARIASKVADAVVYVVRWDNTEHGAVQEGVKEMRTIGAPLVGVAMTMVNESKAAKYAYDGYGYYRGKYRGYYVE